MIRRPSARTRARAGTPTRPGRAALARSDALGRVRANDGRCAFAPSARRRRRSSHLLSQPMPENRPSGADALSPRAAPTAAKPAARKAGKERKIEPWSALLDEGRADERLVREAREGPSTGAPRGHPRGASPRGARGARAARDRAALLPPGTGDPRGHRRSDDRHYRHCLGQVDVLQPADAAHPLRTDARAGAVPVPDQGARPGPGARAERVRADAAGAPGDLRRRHAARVARGHPPQRQRGADQPRHAARRHPPQPRRLGGAVREPRGGGGRRGPRLPRRVRLPRRRRAAAAAAHRRRVRHRPDLPADLGDDRQPGRARRAPDGPGGHRADRRGRLARAGAADRDVEPAADRRRAGHAPLCPGRGRRAARASRARGRARDLLHEVAQGRRAAQPADQAGPRGKRTSRSWPARSSPTAPATPPSSAASWRSG